jgi:putative transposase
MSGVRRRTLIPLAFANLSQWPAPDEHVLEQHERDTYLLRKRAVQMYADGIGHEQITATTGIPREKIF